MARRALRADRKGQFLVLISLGIVVMMVAFSAALSCTAISPLHFPKTNFKETATQLSINFRQALAIALADVSKELDRMASSHQYVNYTKLDEHPEAKDEGYESLTEWQKITFKRQSGLGLKLNVSEPVFDCNWGSAEGYSRAKANMTLDILSYGFYGWKNEVIVELNFTILSLTYIDEDTTSFGFNLKREGGIPVSGVTPSSIKIFFQIDEDRFEPAPASIIGLAYFGDGNYLLTCNTHNATYPIIKMILQDPNGIVVGAYSALTMGGSSLGPKTDIIEPLDMGKFPKSGTKFINITAEINNAYIGGNWSADIAAAEYFLDGEPRIDGTGTPMFLKQGYDWNTSLLVEVGAQIDITGWALGSRVIYVHGMDESGKWGPFDMITLNIVEKLEMHIKNIIMIQRTADHRYIDVYVTIVDEDGIPVDEAEVTGSWQPTGWLNSWVTKAPTNSTGCATLWARKKWYSGLKTFTFTVTIVTKKDWVYNATANEVPSSISGKFYY